MIRHRFPTQEFYRWKTSVNFSTTFSITTTATSPLVEGIVIDNQIEYITVVADKTFRWAVKNGCFSVVKNLLDTIKEVDINAVDEDDDNNLLSLASSNGHLDILKYLIGRGGDIHFFFDNAFRKAAVNGYLNTCEYLISLGGRPSVGAERRRQASAKAIDINALYGYALKFASAKGHLNVVKYLVGLGSDIHGDNDDALKFAAEQGHLNVVKYLVRLGSDIHAENDYALCSAGAYGHFDVVAYLNNPNSGNLYDYLIR